MRRFCMIYYLPPLFLSVAAQRYADCMTLSAVFVMFGYKKCKVIVMMKYFSIFVLSALSAYSVQAADAARRAASWSCCSI